MNNDHKISIIIPAYNAESSLSQALESVLNQTYKNTEILVVNDGSYDGTGKIIDSYQKSHQNIIPLTHTVNKGISAARNTALRAATGDYIMFLDADDTLLPYALEYALSAALYYNADYVDSYQIVHLIGSKIKNTFTEGPLPKKTRAYGPALKSPEIIDKYWYIKGKLLHKSLIKDTFFDESLCLYEDLHYDIILKTKLKNYVLLKKPVYRYCQNINSSVNGRGSKHLFYLSAVGKIKPALSDKPSFIQKRVYSMLYKNALFTILFKLNFDRETPAENRQHIRKVLKELNNTLPEVRRISPILKALYLFAEICSFSNPLLNTVLFFTYKINDAGLYFKCLSRRFPFKSFKENDSKQKMRINMLSIADSVKGQGVGSAYDELLRLMDRYGKNDFEIQINKGIKNCDLIHIHTVEPINFIKMKLSKKPVIAYVHFLPDTLDGSVKLPRIALRVFKKYVVKFYKSADKLVVVNPSFIEKLQKFGIKKEQVSYIPNVVSKEEFYEVNPNKKKKIRSYLQKKYDIPADAFLVMGCGQVQTRKGITDFIKVAEMLPEVHFVWVGGFSFGKITDGYKELSLFVNNPPKNVSFTGIVPRERMVYFYNAADLLFVPSYNELFPMTLLEASNTKTPVLLRDLDLYKPILFDFYLSADNNRDFAALIDRLRKDDAFYREAVCKSVKIADYYSEEKIYEKWKTLYERIVP